MQCLKCVRSHCDEFSASILTMQEELLKSQAETVALKAPVGVGGIKMTERCRQNQDDHTTPF